MAIRDRPTCLLRYRSITERLSSVLISLRLLIVNLLMFIPPESVDGSGLPLPDFQTIRNKQFATNENFDYRQAVE